RQNFSSQVIPGDIRYKDMNGDNIINENDRVPVEVQNFPNHVYGASVGFSYVGFDVSVLFQGTLGGRKNIPYFGPRRFDDVWTPETAETATYPVLNVGINNNVLTDFFLYKSDYVKLKNVEVGYTLGKKLTSRVKVNTLRIFLSG